VPCQCDAGDSYRGRENPDTPLGREAERLVSSELLERGEGAGGECNRLIYIRGCQEHSSPFAGGAVFVRDIQSLVTTEDASLGWRPWVWVCVVPSG
jgi:hypothetical protein